MVAFGQQVITAHLNLIQQAGPSDKYHSEY